jgi:hypothetical protein
MMFRIFWLLLVVIVPLSAQWRRFGSETRPTGGFGIGFSAPVNPLATRLNTGWNLAGGVGIQNGPYGIMLDLLVTGFGINHDELLRQGARNGSQTYWALTVDPVVHINERGPADFYLIGGAGLYGQRTKFRAPATPTSRYDLVSIDHVLKLGVNAGAGFAFNLIDPRFKLFLEARYHHLLTRGPGSSFIPVTVGIRF